jgi:hypothetical protein
MTSKRKADDELSGHLPKIPAHEAPTKDIQGSSAEGFEPDPDSHDIYHAGIPPKLQALTKAVPEIPTITVQQDHVYRVRGLPREISSQQTSDLVSTLFKLESDTSAPKSGLSLRRFEVFRENDGRGILPLRTESDSRTHGILKLLIFPVV